VLYHVCFNPVIDECHVKNNTHHVLFRRQLVCPTRSYYLGNDSAPTSQGEALRVQRRQKKKKSSRKQQQAAERELVELNNEGQSAGDVSHKSDSRDSASATTTETDVSSDASGAGNPFAHHVSPSSATSSSLANETVRRERRTSQGGSAGDDVSVNANDNSDDDATAAGEDDDDNDDTCREEEASLKELLTISQGGEEEEPVDGEGGWSLVSADWYRSWIAFLEGGPRPGRINNAVLLKSASGRDGDAQPRSGLKVGVDYVGFDARAWGILSEVYGADVRIDRIHVDIYGP
jgi:hypothetical protein